MKKLILTKFEADVAERCDGSLSCSAITLEVANIYRVDLEKAVLLVKKAMEKFAAYWALRWQITPSVREDQHGVCSEAEVWREGRLSAPLSVLWELTYACNLRCKHCLTSCGEQRNEAWTLKAARRFIDEMVDMKVFSVTMGGGEPMMHPHLFDLIEYATEKNLNIKLSTNSLLVSVDTIKRLEGKNVFAAQVSVDGLCATRDQLRGKAGSFDRAVGR